MHIEKEGPRSARGETLQPIALNPALDDFAVAHDKEEFLSNERKIIAEALRDLPVGDSFSDMREGIIERHRLLLDALTELYGLDFRTIARTRMQRLGGVMGPQTAVIQLMFDEHVQSQETGGETFFASRIETEGVQLNATSITYIEGFPFAFSVLKREGEDDFGKYGVDFPALSLPREALSAINMYKSHLGFQGPLEEFPLMVETATLFDERVHDIIHALFLYDTKALTKIFQSFSNDIFYTQHLYKDPNKINYEFMVDKMFYKAWQRVFEKNPEVKEELLAKADGFLTKVDQFEDFLNAKDPDRRDYNKRLANFVGFIGIRGITHKMDYNGEEFTKLKDMHPRMERIIELIPENIKTYLDGIYSEEFGAKLPFKESAEEITLKDILERYTAGLLEEFRISVLEGRTSNWQDIVDAVYLIRELPPSIVMQLRDVNQKDFDPKSIIRLFRLLDDVGEKYGLKAKSAVARRIEVDPETGFYFAIDKDDIDFSDGALPTEVLHSKSGMLVQIPYDYPKDNVEIELVRPKTLLQNEKGSVALARPGDFILVNVQDKGLADKLLKMSKTEGVFDFDKFMALLSKEISNGDSSLGDIYPYAVESAMNTFDLQSSGALSENGDGKILLEPGFYRTHKNVRKMFRIDGPVSVEGPVGGERRRIQYGAVALNHIQATAFPDVFPVDQASLPKFYSGVQRSDLAPVVFKKQFKESLGLPHEADSGGVVQDILAELEHINTIKVYGPRGEPRKIKFKELPGLKSE